MPQQTEMTCQECDGPIVRSGKDHYCQGCGLML